MAREEENLISGNELTRPMHQLDGEGVVTTIIAPGAGRDIIAMSKSEMQDVAARQMQLMLNAASG